MLSGFLIGQIIIRDVLSKPSFKNLLTFYKRRWLRTLPLYYTALLLLLLSHHLRNNDPQSSWSYFFFTQNFTTSIQTFFPVSWSLSIEEWSYLLIPLVLMILPVKKYRGYVILLFTAVWAFLILSGRLWSSIEMNPSYDDGIRKSIPLRLDAIIYGFAMANVKMHFPKVFEFLSKSSIFLISFFTFIGLAIVSQNVLAYDFISEPLIPSTIGFSLIGVLFSSWLPFLSTHSLIQKFGTVKPISSFFSRISNYSYCIYLIHFSVFGWFITYTAICWHWALQFSIAVTLTILIAAASFKFFEKPILEWRDRHVKIAP